LPIGLPEGHHSIDNIYVCDCDRYVDRMLEKLDDNVYNTESSTTNLYYFIRTINNELCEVYAELQAAKNDIYLWVDVVDEMVIKGEENGIDCFDNWCVAEIISIGDTPGSSEYNQYIDYVRTCRGVHWVAKQYYGYYPIYGYGYGGYGFEWGSYYNPFYPEGAKEPVTGNAYYVTYRYGVRDENLWYNFGIMADLQKKDYWTWVEYRKAIKSLTIAYLGGPTVKNMRTALATFHPAAFIEIIEGLHGWILGESILYSEADWDNPALDTSDGTLLLAESSGRFEFTVIFHYAYTLPLSTRQVLEEIIEDIKPAHTIASVIFREFD